MAPTVSSIILCSSTLFAFFELRCLDLDFLVLFMCVLALFCIFLVGLFLVIQKSCPSFGICDRVETRIAL